MHAQADGLAQARLLETESGHGKSRATRTMAVYIYGGVADLGWVGACLFVDWIKAAIHRLRSAAAAADWSAASGRLRSALRASYLPPLLKIVGRQRLGACREWEAAFVDGEAVKVIGVVDGCQDGLVLRREAGEVRYLRLELVESVFLIYNLRKTPTRQSHR